MWSAPLRSKVTVQTCGKKLWREQVLCDGPRSPSRQILTISLAELRLGVMDRSHRSSLRNRVIRVVEGKKDSVTSLESSGKYKSRQKFCQQSGITSQQSTIFKAFMGIVSTIHAVVFLRGEKCV